MHNVKYTLKQLQEKIITEKVGDRLLHYSVCKKQATRVSFLKNDRLLFFDETQGIIFYINQCDNVPYKQQKNLPTPKGGQICYIDFAIIKTVPKSPTLVITFNKKNEKNQLVAVQWNFVFEKVGLSRQWATLIRDAKNKKLAKKLGMDEKDKEAAGVINDALSFGMMAKKKEENKDDTQKKDEQKLGNFLMDMANKKNEQNKKQSSIKQSGVKQQSPKKQDSRKKQTWNNTISSPKGQKKLTQSKFKNTTNNSKVQQTNLNKSQTKPLANSGLKKSGVKNNNSDNTNTNLQQVSKPQNTTTLNKNNLNTSKNNTNIPLYKSKAQQNNWNKRFFIKRHQQTILQFNDYVLKIFKDLPQQDLTISQDQVKQISKNGLLFMICHCISQYASVLKNQHKNYHYILQVCQDQPLINVPLTSIISYMGLVCLVKAQLPDSKNLVQDIKDIGHVLKRLEKKTKISNSIWRKNGQFWDVTKSYYQDDKISEPVIYVDKLKDYLPVFSEQKDVIRSEILRDGLNQPLQHSSPLTNDVIGYKRQEIYDRIAGMLSQQEVVITNYNGLKQFMHAVGLNMKCLPKVYGRLQSRQSKKIVHTALIAKIIQKHIQREYSLLDIKQWKNMNSITEDILSYYIEQNNPQGQQTWKSVALELKRKYRVTLNPHQICGGFLLSSLILMFNWEIDPSKINKQKQLLADTDILAPGFILSINPKTKIYHKLRSRYVDKILKLADDKLQNISILKNLIHDKQHNFSDDIILSQHMKMQFYSNISRSLPYSSSQKDVQQLKENIYKYINFEPVSIFSHQITLQYLRDCLKQNKHEEYKSTINIALDLLIFWCGQDHMYVCDIYSSLSDYYAIQQFHEDSINFMKQALTTCIRSGGTHTKRAGIKYFELGTRQLMFGFKTEAFENLSKAKNNMELYQQKPDQYPLLLNKLATLYLNKGETESCIALTVKALQQSENYQIDDAILIKNYLMLCRAYQISGDKQKLENLGHLCAKVFNNTTDYYTFDQMIRICVTSGILSLSQAKQQKIFQIFKQKDNRFNDKDNSENSLDQLMRKAKSCLVMEKFLSKINQTDRVFSQTTAVRESVQNKETKWFIQTTFRVVGIDFVMGILAQAYYAA